MPPKLASELLPRLITRRPAQRMSAREFQQASYFDNILVSTIRFLDDLPAKTANEKAQFLRGLPRIMPQFPKSVLEKKVLPALLEEMKDRDLLAPIMSNVFAMVKSMPTGKRAFTEQVVPKLKEVFVNTKPVGERDTSREAGLMILLENMNVAAENCPGKEFTDNLLPIILVALESPTHALVDAALSTLPSILPTLDYVTIKFELFPVIATVFAKTSSLNIKIRGLEAFYVLIGGSATASAPSDNDDINGIGFTAKKPTSTTSSSGALDKVTVQEKIVPLIQAIKTKEPGVMMAALKVFRQVGEVADTDFLAMDILPTLWSMSLGPLLNLVQFQEFMALIKSLSGRIEREQTKKLRELGNIDGSNHAAAGARGGGRAGVGSELNGLEAGETDFETLVSGRKSGAAANGDLMNDWSAAPSQSVPQGSQTQSTEQPMMFSWQSTANTQQPPQRQMAGALRAATQPSSRAITPDQAMSSFAALAPTSTQYSQPLQPNPQTNALPMRSMQQPGSFNNAMPANNYGGTTGAAGSSINWSSATQQQQPFQPQQQQPQTNGWGSFNIAPPPTSPQALGSFAPPPAARPLQAPVGGSFGGSAQGQQNQATPRSGLDKYESLL